MIEISFEERLKFISKNEYQIAKNVKVEEKEEAGKAEVLFSSTTNVLMSISLSQENRLKYINYSEVADGTVVELLENDKINLHIVECKKSVNEEKWEKVKNQLRGGIVNSLALGGVLNKSIKNIFLYTAFRNESFKKENSTNPVLLKATLGTNQKSSSLDWNDESIKILKNYFKHIKIQLDDNGYGKVEFKGL